MPQRRFEDLVCAWCAGAAFAPVAGQSVERGDPDPGVGIVGHSDQLAHGVGVDQVVEEAAAALADGRILVLEASTDRAHRVFAAPQQLVIGRDGTLRVAQARDEGLVVGPDESEHDLKSPAERRIPAKGFRLGPAGSACVYLPGGAGCGSLRRVPDESVPDDAAGLCAVNARLRTVVEAKDAEIAGLRAERDADRELIRRLELRLEELERRLCQDSTDSGTPTSKEGIGARERRKAERADPDRGRRKDRKPGGQPGHPGKGLARDPDPGERKAVPPPAECRRCKAGLEGAEPAAGSWAQVIDVLFRVITTEWELPGRKCPCCGEATVAAAPPGAHAGSVPTGRR